MRRLRKDKGWSQDELAAKLKIEQMAISLLENSRANPTLELIEAIAICFGVRFVDLFETKSAR